MIGSERENAEREVLHRAVMVERNYEATRTVLEMKGEKLELLGRALRTSPESVRPVPEIDGPDYRDGLNMLNCRQEIVSLCDELRSLQDNRKTIAQRKAGLGLP